VVPNLPCELPGGDACPPADDAEQLVPADALAYVHANLAEDEHGYASVAELANKLPLLGGQIADRGLDLIPSPGGGRLDFEQAVRPWFGGEAAIAVLTPAGAGVERVNLLEVSDGEGASDYARSLAVGAPRTADYEGVDVTTDERDVATAQVGGFLAIGTEDGVRAVIATATGADEAESLADDPIATEVRERLPEHRFAEAWVSADGVAELIADDTGTLGTLAPLVAPGATRGVAASISADDDGLELALRSALDPERERASPGFFAAFPQFDPDLPERLPSETLAYLGIGDPEQTVTALLSQASAEAPGIAAGFADLVEDLRRGGGVDIEGELLGALGDQAAVTLEPPPGGAEAAGALPYLMFVADGVDENATREALAALLQGPDLAQEQVSGVETNRLRVSPTIELTYAVFDGLVAVATDPAGVAGLIDDEGGLDEQRLYDRATEGFPDQLSLLAYLDLAGLVTIGEQAGLAEDPLYATFAGDIRRLDALGLAVSDSDDLLATDLRLLVGDPPARGEGPATPAPPGD
jgi:hypothetical protein